MSEKSPPTVASRIRRGFVIQTTVIVVLVLAQGVALLLIAAERSNRVAADKAVELQRAEEAATQVGTCYQRIGSTRQFLGVLRGLEIVIANQVAGTSAVLREDPFGPESAARRRILRRARPALADTRDLVATIEANLPTAKECAVLRCRLDRQRGEATTPRCAELLRRRGNG